MKKILSMILALAMVFALCACGQSAAPAATAADASADAAEPAAEETAADSDLAYVQDKGTLIVGITDFAPMDYKDDSGEWIGFDADTAKAFAESIGVTAEFVEIDWDNKILELNNKSIDCVWNGMTLTDEVAEGMGVSDKYCKNAQVVILPADKVDSYKTAESLKSLNFAVEIGSAGKDQLDALGCKYTEVGDQTKAVMEVAAGTADAAVVDLLLAGNLVGEGTSYSKLAIGMKLNDEEFFVVGFRKDSALVEKFNEFWAAASADGSLESTAKKYGVQEAIIKK